MRALVVLNPGSGSLATLGIDRGRERVAASCEANNLVATIAIAPGSGISERIEGELSSSREGTGWRALSFAAGVPVSTNSADTMAGGLAVRVPDPEALDIIRRGAARILTVSEAEMRRAMRILFSDTHNIAEGAGAAALAASLQERGRVASERVAVIQSGGNIDRTLFAEVLAEDDKE